MLPRPVPWGPADSPAGRPATGFGRRTEHMTEPSTILNEATNNPPIPDSPNDLTPDKFKHLKDAAHIRQRPGMYIGDTGTSGLHHLIYELVHNCVDEALAGWCHNIHVQLNVDN